jgi:hypothetical protein
MIFSVLGVYQPNIPFFIVITKESLSIWRLAFWGTGIFSRGKSWAPVLSRRDDGISVDEK